MKKFVAPEMEIIEFKVGDVLVASGDYVSDVTEAGQNDF